MLTQMMSAMQMQNNEYQNAATIQSQMVADSQKQQMDRWKIAQDTQTKIFEITQDVTVQRAKTQDKVFQHWDQYIRG